MQVLEGIGAATSGTFPTPTLTRAALTQAWVAFCRLVVFNGSVN